jgi:alpha-beta hydrolase superfamily lysophospholipase
MERSREGSTLYADRRPPVRPIRNSTTRHGCVWSISPTSSLPISCDLHEKEGHDVPALKGLSHVAPHAHVLNLKTEDFSLITFLVLILHGTADKVTKPGGSQLFFDSAGSKDKTLNLYDGSSVSEPTRPSALPM